MAKDEASVGSGWVLDGEHVCGSYVTDIDGANVITADFVHATLHKALEPAS